MPLTVIQPRAIRPRAAAAVALVIAQACGAALAETPTAPFSAADLTFFETSIRPLLVAHCHQCHAAGAADIRSGLRVDDRDALLAGGDGGVVIDRERPESSRLLAVLRSTDPDVQMPPRGHGGPLPDASIALVADWIARGLPMPAGDVPRADPHEALATHWAFQPVTAVPPPAVADGAWAWGDVDRFILARLEAQGLRPVADATPAGFAFWTMRTVP